MDSSTALTRLYRQVDIQALRLTRLHHSRLQCRLGCPSCCVDGITVFAIEADRIRRKYAILLTTASPHPLGGCAFLTGAGGCTIYPHRPYVCRTQGLPLRWIEERGDNPTVELRDICPLNTTGDPLENLPPDQCWTIGPFEERLAELQHAATGDLRRVDLRSLFHRR